MFGARARDVNVNLKASSPSFPLSPHRCYGAANTRKRPMLMFHLGSFLRSLDRRTSRRSSLALALGGLALVSEAEAKKKKAKRKNKKGGSQKPIDRCLYDRLQVVCSAQKAKTAVFCSVDVGTRRLSCPQAGNMFLTDALLQSGYMADLGACELSNGLSACSGIDCCAMSAEELAVKFSVAAERNCTLEVLGCRPAGGGVNDSPNLPGPAD
jgi:hypothetical protein